MTSCLPFGSKWYLLIFNPKSAEQECPVCYCRNGAGFWITGCVCTGSSLSGTTSLIIKPKLSEFCHSACCLFPSILYIMIPVCGTCLYYRSPLTDLMFSFMQTEHGMTVDIRCAECFRSWTFQHNHLGGLQRTVWTSERKRRAAVLWEKTPQWWEELCQAW